MRGWGLPTNLMVYLNWRSSALDNSTTAPPSTNNLFFGSTSLPLVQFIQLFESFFHSLGQKLSAIDYQNNICIFLR